MRIGAYELVNNVFVAPMAGVTDRPFRQLCKRMGAGYAVSEMAASNPQLWHTDKSTRRMNHVGETAPIAVQIAGSDPAMLAHAAAFNVDKGAQIIDINMGCPTPKIVKNNEGAALMRDPEKAAALVAAVVSRVRVPVTVKMRKGWSESTVNAVELAQLVTAAGAAAVTVHGRTRDQFYSGRADWEIIAAVKRAVNVPVIGNGDIRTPVDAREMLRQTGCNGVMIGRAALGNPWIFSQTVHYLKTGELLPGPTNSERIAMALRHFDLLVRFKGERVAVWEMRKHAAWYTRGLRNSARLRESINRAQTPEEIKDLLISFLAGESGA